MKYFPSKSKVRIIKVTLLFAGLCVHFSCGGGGGSAGQQSVIRIVNATTDAGALESKVDGEVLSTGVRPGNASLFESVLAGDRLIQISEAGGLQRTLEIENNFGLGVPYTLVVTSAGLQLTPILAVSDRSDTPPAQFRIRAINASSKVSGGVSVRLIPIGSNRNGSSINPILRADLTPTAVPTFSATFTPSATPTIAGTATALPTSTPIQSAQPTPISSTEVALGSNLGFGSIADYVLVPRADYSIVVTSGGSVIATTGLITFNGGQVVSILVRDATQAEGSNVAILRLDDKPQ